MPDFDEDFDAGGGGKLQERSGTHTCVTGKLKRGGVNKNVLHIYTQIEYTKFIKHCAQMWDERPGQERGSHWNEVFSQVHRLAFDIDFAYIGTASHCDQHVLKHLLDPLLELICKLYPAEAPELIVTCVDPADAPDDKIRGGVHIYATNIYATNETNISLARAYASRCRSDKYHVDTLKGLAEQPLEAQDQDGQQTIDTVPIFTITSPMDKLVDPVIQLRMACSKKETKGCSKKMRGHEGCPTGSRCDSDPPVLMKNPRFYRPRIRLRYMDSEDSEEDDDDDVKMLERDWVIDTPPSFDAIRQTYLGEDDEKWLAEVWDTPKLDARIAFLTSIAMRSYGQAETPYDADAYKNLGKVTDETSTSTDLKWKTMKSDDDRMCVMRQILPLLLSPVVRHDTVDTVMNQTAEITTTGTPMIRWYFAASNNYCPFHTIDTTKTGAERYVTHNNRSFIMFYPGYIVWRSMKDNEQKYPDGLPANNGGEDGKGGGCFFKRYVHHVTNPAIAEFLFGRPAHVWLGRPRKYDNDTGRLLTKGAENAELIKSQIKAVRAQELPMTVFTSDHKFNVC